MFIGILVAVVLLLIMLGVDVFSHDQTLSEAIKGSPHQILHYFGVVAALAWQYKIATVLVLGIIIAIVVIRRVPAVKAH